jgi:hypothetical protein
LVSDKGRVGIIVQSGIATDESNKGFFAELAVGQRLVSLFDFVNLEGFFPGIHRTHPHFCALTITGNKIPRPAEFAFYMTRTEQLLDPRRRFALSQEDFLRLNPNTRTCPVFRSKADAELTKKFYRSAPILIDEHKHTNPWSVQLRQGLFNMTSDSGLFEESPSSSLLPLYEAKMIWHFDHRWATCEDSNFRDCTIKEKSDPTFYATPRYWVSEGEVESRLGQWRHDWLLGFRDITNATNERTAIFTVLPRVGIGNNTPLIFADKITPRLQACLLANLNSLTFDYVARQKVGGTHLNFFVLNQLPVQAPGAYGENDVDFIAPRITELVCTAEDLLPFARDLGHNGSPYTWDDEHRARIRSELDAYFAHLYGLTRDELRYVLDPKDVFGEEFPSETFRVLKEREEKECGEYRTRRLLLDAFDNLAASPRFRDEIAKRESALEIPQKSVQVVVS